MIHFDPSTRFDPSQQRVLELDAGRHARVLGAPGSGKSLLAIESFARAVELPGIRDEHVLLLAPTRLAASRLRGMLERRLNRAIGGTPVRTAASLAFAVLAREFAAEGLPAPRLLTGTSHDEAVARCIDERLAAGASAQVSAFAPEVLLSERFRAELRELGRVLDDFDLTIEEVMRRIGDARDGSTDAAFTRAPDGELAERWRAAFEILAAVQAALQRERPHEFTASGLMRRAAAVLRESASASVPRLLIVDDAQQLSEGELAILAACAQRGSSVWVFGDPDVSASAFQGESTAVLTRLSAELARRGAKPAPGERAEQSVVLEYVHRHGAAMRELVTGLTGRIGAAGAGQQRAARSAVQSTERVPVPVRFARVASSAEQLGAIAYRLRERHLGLGGVEAVPWHEMAVICRSRGEVSRVARLLAERQIPTGVVAGGVVLREHRVVRELIALLRHSLGSVPFDAQTLAEILGGRIGGLDTVAVRRLRGALLLEERRQARAQQRSTVPVDDLLLEGFEFPADRALIDSAGGRALRRLGRIAAAGRREHERGGSPREVLWAIWQATGLADRWQTEALGALGARSDAANRALDAVVALFFVLQRHEEQSSEQPIDELLEEILATDVPEDSLAARSARDEITVTTAQGALGLEFSLVCIIGPQEGVWPNLRAQGSLLGRAAFERWLLGGEALQPERRETLHDELRLFALACSRARDELLVVSVSDDTQHPGPFFRLGDGAGAGAETDAELPSAQLTLRGAVAEMRRRLVADADDHLARDSLVALASAQVPGAHPDEWYGVRAPSTEAPLVDLAADPEIRVPVRPSELERAEACPLDWAIQRFGGGTGGLSASLGTLVHHLFETVDVSAPEIMFETLAAEWGKLRFDAAWEAQRMRETAEAMVQGLIDYLAAFDASGAELIDSEASFSVSLDRAELTGTADRVELRTGDDGNSAMFILDLKTGATAPSAAATEQHSQLQTYQIGLILGGFEGVSADAAHGGASLLFVHPKVVKGRNFVEFTQPSLDEEAQRAITARIADIAQVMAAAQFVARVEHHCTNEYATGACSLHIIPAVSHA